MVWQLRSLWHDTLLSASRFPCTRVHFPLDFCQLDFHLVYKHPLAWGRLLQLLTEAQDTQ